MKEKRLISIVTAVGILLLIPLVAMQFTDEVNWNLFDFLIMGALLLATGFVIEIILRKVRKTSQRIALCGITLLILALIWIELAVGIFGSPIAGS